MADLLGVYAMAAGVRRVDHAHRPVRRLTLSVVGWGEGRTVPDPDNVAKLFLDACRRCGLIVDDSREWLEFPTPVLTVGSPDCATVTVEDLRYAASVAPDEDPYTRRLLAGLTRSISRGKKGKKG